LNRGIPFWVGIGISIASTVMIYLVLVWVLKFSNISIL
jgi:hypothetical protein